MFYVYILINPQNKTYIGQTQDLQKRLAEHNDPECFSTLYTKRIPCPWSLLHCETFQSRSEAMKRKKELKTGKGRDWIKSTLLTGC